LTAKQFFNIAKAVFYAVPHFLGVFGGFGVAFSVIEGRRDALADGGGDKVPKNGDAHPRDVLALLPALILAGAGVASPVFPGVGLG